MSHQATKAAAFHALHVTGHPLILFNAWDAGSAKTIAASGAHAIATGSWSVAAAHGFPDGEKLPLTLALENLARIVAATDLPVSIDIESGYGDHPSDVAETISRTIQAGAIACNVEDSLPTTGHLREIPDQANRLRAIRAAAERANLAYFINARTDIFFQSPPETHDAAMLDAALQRAHAYAAAGANGIFMPGLIDLKLIEHAASASPLPLNIMAGQGTPSLAALAQAGVSRISHGPGPYLAATQGLVDAARAAFAGSVETQAARAA